MSKDEMGFEELMSLEGRLRRAEALGGEEESLARARRTVQAHVNAGTAPVARRWGQRLSMFAVVGIPAAAAAIAGVVLLTAHPQKAIVPAPANSPSPAPTASPSPGEALVTPSPTLVADLPCKLPVSGADLGLNGPWIRGAFMSYPSGTVTRDPGSEVLVPADAFGGMRMKNRPELRGDSSVPSYDRAMRQWLPVRFDAISPDGKQYAWVDVSALGGVQGSPGAIRQPIHIVDVATGVDRVVHSADQFDGPTWDAGNAIYLVHHLAQTDASQGLWRLDPATGTVIQVDANGANWQHPGSGSAWANGPSIDPNAAKGPGDAILHLDLASGTAATWFRRPGQWVSMVGTDSQGRALVAVGAPNSSAGQALWMVSGPNAATQLIPGGAPGGLTFMGSWPDRTINWISAAATGANQATALFRLDSSGKIVRVASTNAQPTGGCH